MKYLVEIAVTTITTSTTVVDVPNIMDAKKVALRRLHMKDVNPKGRRIAAITIIPKVFVNEEDLHSEKT